VSAQVLSGSRRIVLMAVAQTVGFGDVSPGVVLAGVLRLERLSQKSCVSGGAKRWWDAAAADQLREGELRCQVHGVLRSLYGGIRVAPGRAGTYKISVTNPDR